MSSSKTKGGWWGPQGLSALTFQESGFPTWKRAAGDVLEELANPSGHQATGEGSWTRWRRKEKEVTQLAPRPCGHFQTSWF